MQNGDGIDEQVRRSDKVEPPGKAKKLLSPSLLDQEVSAQT